MGLFDDLPTATKPEPVVTPPKEKSGVGSAIKDTIVDDAKYYANRVNKGFFDFVGNVAEAYRASGLEPLPTSAARVFLGSELVDALGISPYSIMKENARVDAAMKGKLREFDAAREADPLTKEGITARFAPDMEAPGPVSRMIGAGLEVASNPANLVGGPTGAGTKAAPLLSRMIKPGVVAFGAGAGGELGREAGGPLAVMAGGEDARQTGETIGTLVGAVAGGHANDIRMNAVSAVGSKIISPAKNVAGAVKSAIAAKRAGDERNLTRIFMDNYSDLSAQGQGILKEHVQGQFADAIARDPDAQTSLQQFEQAIRDSGGPSEAPWNLGQRATTPILVEEIKLRQPFDRAEAEKMADAARSTQKDVERRYRSLFERTVDVKTPDAVEALDQLRKETNLKLDVLATQAQQNVDKVVHWDMPGTPKTADMGAQLRALADQEVQKTRGIATSKYAAALDTADQTGVQINPDKFKATIGTILDEVLTQVDPKTAPGVGRLASVVRPELSQEGQRIKELQDMLLTADAPTKLKLNREIFDLRKQMKTTSEAPLSLRDANDLSVALNTDARAAASSGAPTAAVAARNIERLRQSLEDTIAGNLPPDIAQSYNDARAYYRDVQVPRAREGANANIRRQAGSARAGEERVTDENVFNEYLKPGELETRMKQFDNLFSGKLTGEAPNKQAYDLLGQAIEDKYYRDVTSGPITPEKHEAFMRKYNSALERAPATREKLDATFAQAQTLEEAKNLQVQRWKDISAHPLTQAFGPDGARQVMARALSDPNRMNQLINYTVATHGEKGLQPLVKYIMEVANPMRDGSFDAGRLLMVLNSGKAEENRIGAMQVLFEKAYGKELGQRHLNNLQAIGVLADRQRLTDPRFLRPQGSQDIDPITGALGQSGASILSHLNAVAQGRVSPVWASAVSGGRFLNLQLGRAIRQLQYDALFDPKASDAVLEMAKTDGRRPLAKSAAEQLTKRMGAEGKGFMQKLVDTGAVKPISIQAGRIGLTEAAKASKEDDSGK